MLSDRFVISDEQWVFMEPYCLGKKDFITLHLKIQIPMPQAASQRPAIANPSPHQPPETRLPAVL